jgi:hypothetical protein
MARRRRHQRPRASVATDVRGRESLAGDAYRRCNHMRSRVATLLMLCACVGCSRDPDSDRAAGPKKVVVDFLEAYATGEADELASRIAGPESRDMAEALARYSKAVKSLREKLGPKWIEFNSTTGTSEMRVTFGDLDTPAISEISFEEREGDGRKYRLPRRDELTNLSRFSTYVGLEDVGVLIGPQKYIVVHQDDGEWKVDANSLVAGGYNLASYVEMLEKAAGIVDQHCQQIQAQAPPANSNASLAEALFDCHWNGQHP